MTLAEARHLVFKLYGIRPSHAASLRHLEDLLLYRTRRTPANRVNAMRDELVIFVAENRDRLSLYCDGNCYNHMDAVVMNCYAQLRDNDATAGEAKT